MVHNEVRDEGRGLPRTITTSQEIQVDDLDPRRVELRRWLTEHPTPSGRELAEGGLVAPSWPERGEERLG